MQTTYREDRTATRSLWHNLDFLKLWGAQSISLFGSEITTLAIPLMAVLLLNASAWQMGLLGAFGKAPFLIFSLLAGVWIDRISRRPVLIGADIGRAILLLSIPAAAYWGELSMLHLYIVVFAVGVLSVFFDVAHYAYVPSLVPRAQLVEGNSKIQTSYSVAEAGGPGVAGLLTQAVSAPFALLIDVATFIGSAVLLGVLRTPEPQPAMARAAINMRQEIALGLRTLLGHPLLRIVIIASVVSELFSAALLAMYVLYGTHDLHLSPATLGLIFGVGGLAAVLGAWLAGRVARRFGVGKAIVFGWLLESAALLIIPLASGSATVFILLTAQAVIGCTGAIANIHQWTLRQAVTPDTLQGRVTASHRFLVYGASAVGALLGGVLGSLLGLRLAMVVCALGAVLGRVYACFSPLRQLREQPSGPELGITL